jgi:hypothetical protein
VSQLYPRALGSLLVSSYDSQGYSGGVSTTEDLLGRKSSGSGLESREYGRWDLSR